MFLPTQYLNPVVLRCCHFDGYTLERNTRYTPRMVYDYEVEYYLKSSGGIKINGRFIPFQEGEINIRKPGQNVEGIPPYECYILCVDFLGNAKRCGNYSFGTPDEAQIPYENPLLASLPDKLIPHNRELIAGLMETILRNDSITGDLAEFKIKSSLHFLFSELFSEAADQSASGSTKKVRNAIRYIRGNFLEPLRVEELIMETGLSRAFFHQCFLRETGLTPGQLIQKLRMEKAINLLSFTDIPVGEIGASCGYPDSVYFTRLFHRHTGLTPTAYRKRMETT